jgi:hypothetical protein
VGPEGLCAGVAGAGLSGEVELAVTESFADEGASGTATSVQTGARLCAGAGDDARRCGRAGAGATRRATGRDTTRWTCDGLLCVVGSADGVVATARAPLLRTTTWAGAER